MKIFPHRLEGHPSLINVGGWEFVSKPLLNGYPLSLGSDFVFLKGIYLFFGCAGSSLLCGLFSHCGERGLLSSCSTLASFVEEHSP